MRTRSVLVATLATAALAIAVPASAQAKTAELLDRSLYSSTRERTASTFHLEGFTRGILDSYLDVTITAKDGTLPTTFGSCEPADGIAVLTPSPGETLAEVRPTPRGPAVRCRGPGG